MDVLVVGAGIGGLATALFLHNAGLSARVFEAAPRIRELGVGINIQPHAVAELDRIGLLEPLAAAGNPCERWSLYNMHGQPIWSEPRGRAAGHDMPQISVHRGRLQTLLAAAVRHRLGPDALVTGHRLTGFRQTADRVIAEFAIEASRQDIAGDALVGADGIHSVTRSRLNPGEGPPAYGGQVLWRGVTRQPPFSTGREMIIAGHDKQKIIAYPITGPDRSGRALVNWIAEVPADRMTAREDWNRPGRAADFAHLYRDWAFPWLDVPRMIDRCDTIYEFPMVDRDPLDRWTSGRVTLLGDAAHPMYPIGANGASQAIRDAAALAGHLSGGDVVRGLRAYDADRRPVTNRIVVSNRRLGPERVMRLAHERAPEGFTDVNDVLTREELEDVAGHYNRITWAR